MLPSRVYPSPCAHTDPPPPQSVTRTTDGVRAKWMGRPGGLSVLLIDSPGLADSYGCDQENINGMVQYLRALGHGVDAILLVVNAANSARLSGAFQDELRLLQQVLGAGFWAHCALVLTHCDAGAEGAWESKAAAWRTQAHDMLRDCLGVGVRLPVICLSADPNVPHQPDSPGYAELARFVAGQTRYSCDALQTIKAAVAQEAGLSGEALVAQQGKTTDVIKDILLGALRQIATLLVSSVFKMVLSSCTIV